MRQLLGITLLTLMCSAAAPAWAEQGAQATVEAANLRIQKLVGQPAAAGSPAAKARDAQLKQIVTELLDLDQMAQDALGRNWAKRTPAERREYSTLLKQLVERSYLRQARSHHQYTVTFQGTTPARRGRVEVESVVHIVRRGRREEIEVVYTVAQSAGRWRVVDISTDGVSTIRNYRSQFRRIISQDGFPALLERMRSRLAAGEVDL